MEDGINGNKTTGRRPKWKITAMEYDLNGPMEDTFNGNQPQYKTTTIEDDFNGR